MNMNFFRKMIAGPATTILGIKIEIKTIEDVDSYMRKFNEYIQEHLSAFQGRGFRFEIETDNKNSLVISLIEKALNSKKIKYSITEIK